MLYYRHLDLQVLFPSSPKTAKYVCGRWGVKGICGSLINILACVYVLIVGFFSFWPSTLEATPTKTNYSSLYWALWLLQAFCTILVGRGSTSGGRSLRSMALDEEYLFFLKEDCLYAILKSTADYDHQSFTCFLVTDS